MQSGSLARLRPLISNLIRIAIKGKRRESESAVPTPRISAIPRQTVSSVRGAAVPCVHREYGAGQVATKRTVFKAIRAIGRDCSRSMRFVT